MTQGILAVVAAAGLVLAIADGQGSPAAGENRDFATLRVGLTGIVCYTEPCPWNGIVKAGEPIRPAGVIWSGDTPPPMIASEADERRIRAAYRHGCTLINGRFVGGVLEVAKILGSC